MLLSTSVFARILAVIISILSLMFPNNKDLIGMRQQYENDPAKWAPIIMDAIKENDVKTVEDLMCKNIKDNTDDLSGEIQALYDCIEGDIVSIEWEYRGGGYSESQRDGRKILQEGFSIYITTTADDYAIGFGWEIINNFQPDEAKIRSMGLVKNYEPYERLYLITATEGIRCWHE